MKRKVTFARLAFIILVLISLTIPLAGGDPKSPQDTTSKSLNPPDNFNGLRTEEKGELQLREDFYWNLIYLIGTFAGLLLTYQIYAGISQMRREGKRDLAEIAGVKQVTEVMTVVQQTLEGRLAAEKEVERVLNQVKPLENFYQRFQTKIHKSRESLEDTAFRWARDWKRHDFRSKVKDMDKFAGLFDEFIDDSNLLGEDDSQTLSARVLYIRGITAHYANEPELAKRYLSQVINRSEPESGEDKIAYNRRVANAYYYLGLIESNFGNKEQAIAYFENANKLDSQYRDYLTKIVIAEAYAMGNNFSQAHRQLTSIEKGIAEMEAKEGGLISYHLRLQSRGILIKANMVYSEQKENWQEEVIRLLTPVRFKDSQYYYSTATLAQAYAASGNFTEASNLFNEAYKTILQLKDLETVKEVRSRILLLMVAGMCSKHSGIEDGERMSNDYLHEANTLRESLPKIDSLFCTVFSPLSKNNEDSTTIYNHIDAIRKGQIFIS